MGGGALPGLGFTEFSQEGSYAGLGLAPEADPGLLAPHFDSQLDSFVLQVGPLGHVTRS